MILHNSAQQLANELANEITEQTERIIFQQFINLVRDGAITIKKTQPCVTVSYSPKSADPELRMSNYVELTFKGEEVIERLKKENQELESKLRAISLAVKGVGE